MHALGNSDFFFFRMYVDGANGGQTRFGDTTIIMNADVLSEHGWISLHDQLNPFPRPIHRRYYYQSRLLRTSCATGAGSDKRLWSGIQHTYRTGPVKTWLGRKDETKFNYDQAKLTSTLEHKFLSEIFYGSQCYLGIALSLLRELRNMRSTGYLNQLFQDRNRDEVDNREVLGSLIRNLFKIEAKLPVSVNIHKGCSRSIQAQLADDESHDHGYLGVFHQTYTCQPRWVAQALESGCTQCRWRRAVHRCSRAQ